MSRILEERIGEWRAWLRRRPALRAADVDELEDHLRGQVAALGEAGLDEDEAFLVAVKRLGDLDSINREYAREYSERLWKQLVVAPRPDGGEPGARRDAAAAVGLAVAAAVAFKVPELLGRPLHAPDDAHLSFYWRNASLFVLPLPGRLLRLEAAARLRPGGPWAALPFLAGGLVVNLLPYEPGGHTEVLAALHLPIALWLGVGFAYAGGAWRDHAHRMNFLRFSGEWFIYYTLIALGGGVLTGFTAFVFQAIGWTWSSCWGLGSCRAGPWARC